MVRLGAKSGDPRQRTDRNSSRVAEGTGRYLTDTVPIRIDARLAADRLAILQQLAEPDLRNVWGAHHSEAWIAVERLLRRYAEYHFARSIRSASLIDTYLAASG